jgi:hypothetical protein
MKNCIIKDRASFEFGGYNKQDVIFIIENNIFGSFVNFINANFDGPFIFRNNILLAESNLLGHVGSGYEAKFNQYNIIEDNIGIINISDFDFN